MTGFVKGFVLIIVLQCTFVTLCEAEGGQLKVAFTGLERKSLNLLLVESGASDFPEYCSPATLGMPHIVNSSFLTVFVTKISIFYPQQINFLLNLAIFVIKAKN